MDRHEKTIIYAVACAKATRIREALDKDDKDDEDQREMR